MFANMPEGNGGSCLVTALVFRRHHFLPSPWLWPPTCTLQPPLSFGGEGGEKEGPPEFSETVTFPKWKQLGWAGGGGLQLRNCNKRPFQMSQCDASVPSYPSAGIDWVGGVRWWAGKVNLSFDLVFVGVGGWGNACL